jgi:hypothetical protein
MLAYAIVKIDQQVILLKFLIHNNLNQTDLWRARIEKDFTLPESNSIEGLTFVKLSEKTKKL